VDHSIGVFTTPKSGIYEFYFNGHKTKTSEFLNISLRINGKDVVNAMSDFMGGHDFRVQTNRRTWTADADRLISGLFD